MEKFSAYALAQRSVDFSELWEVVVNGEVLTYCRSEEKAYKFIGEWLVLQDFAVRYRRGNWSFIEYSCQKSMCVDPIRLIQTAES